MKQILCLICCIALSFAFIGCHAPDASFDNSTDVWKLVKQTTVEKNGTTSVTTFEYNDVGNLVKYEILVGDIADTVKEVAYDAKGYKNYEKGISKSGFVTEIFWTNDEKGRPIEQKSVMTFKDFSSESLSQYEYTDEYDSYVQTFLSGASKGNTITVTKDEHRNELSHIESNSTTIHYENKYEDNRLIERVSTSGSLLTKTIYDYDDAGNLIKETSYDIYGNITLTQIYEYAIIEVNS